MKYIKNKNMEFLDIDDDNLAVYDPVSGDTHYINGTGKTIISLLDNETEKEKLIDKLCEDFYGSREAIANDLSEFLGDLIEKKVVTCL